MAINSPAGADITDAVIKCPASKSMATNAASTPPAVEPKPGTMTAISSLRVIIPRYGRTNSGASGAVVGAVAGGLAGKGIAEAIDPTAEESYWRENYSRRPYVQKGSSFDDYGPAYRYGVDSYGRSKGRTFEQAEADLQRGWEQAKGRSSLSWDRARDASRDSWQRVSDTIESAVPGDSDRDGK